eukprot:TRINITY_DN109388_c0_g1_i1.p1 TRINITY_DN109388_c0_g1~~TRINITY_DN109388_c0_g1_i1.p1  ORF type:complete len:443 (+),score=77.41 TRINITY_DN109388_c0_g1_i1:67-1395(+)
MALTPMAPRVAAPYPIARMCFNLLLLLSLGSLSSFSIWSSKLSQTFPSWTPHEVQLVYSAGLFGAWSQPLGGFFYDNFGSRKTKILGTALVALGFASMSLCTQHPSVSPAILAFLYFLEEQGAATLQVSITCDAFKHFPSNSMGITMGLCTFGFAGSGFLWTAILSVCSHLPLPAIFSIVGGAIVTSVIPQFLYSSREGVHASEAAGTPSFAQYCTALLSKRFFVIWGIAVCLRSPTWLIFGLLKNRGVAAGIDGVALVGACLASNAIIRLPMGWAWDAWSRRWADGSVGGASLQNLMAFLTLLFSLGASLLVADALQTQGQLVWVGSLLCSLTFGCIAPLANVWIRENFEPEVRGGVFGVHSISISIGNLGMTAMFGPSATTISRDFLNMSVAILVLSVFLLAILLLVRRGPPPAETTVMDADPPPASPEKDIELQQDGQV